MPRGSAGLWEAFGAIQRAGLLPGMQKNNVLIRQKGVAPSVSGGCWDSECVSIVERRDCI